MMDLIATCFLIFLYSASVALGARFGWNLLEGAFDCYDAFMQGLRRAG